MFKLCMLVVGSTMVMLAGVEALTFQDQYDVWAADLVSTQNKAEVSILTIKVLAT